MKELLPRRRQKEGWTLIEMLVAIPVASIAMLIIFSVIWAGTRLITRNLSVNLAHMNVVSPMQRLSDDVRMAIATPQLTGTLAAGALGTVPGGYASGSTKAWSRGKTTSWSLPVVSGSGPAAGIQLYLMVGSTYTTGSNYTDPFGAYPVTKAGYPVANGSYTSSATSINIELTTSADQALFTSAANGMHLCIPSAPVLVSGTGNYAMADKKITGVTFSGAAASGTNASTLVATCSFAGTLGISGTLQTYGTRTANTSATVLVYLVEPVNYFVCGTDMIRLNYDGNWEVVMRNVLPTNKTWTQAQPFSMPWPYTKSFLSTSADGQRAVRVRLAATNPDYTSNVTLSSDINNRFRGLNSDMLLYDIDLWSRMPIFDELVR